MMKSKIVLFGKARRLVGLSLNFIPFQIPDSCIIQLENLEELSAQTSSRQPWQTSPIASCLSDPILGLIIIPSTCRRMTHCWHSKWEPRRSDRWRCCSWCWSWSSCWELVRAFFRALTVLRTPVCPGNAHTVGPTAPPPKAGNMKIMHLRTWNVRRSKLEIRWAIVLDLGRVASICAKS